MITPAHLAQMPPGWTLRLTPEGRMVAAVAPDGVLTRHFDTAEEAIAWANDPDDVAAWRVRHAAIEAQVAQQRAASVNRTVPAPGWSVRHRRATDDWEASRGAQSETFETEEDAIAFTHA